MALAEGPPPVWFHDSVPYLQMIDLRIGLADGRQFRLLSQHEDGTGTHGLFLYSESSPSVLASDAAASTSIYRDREAIELPTGKIDDLRIRNDGSNVVELTLEIGPSTIRLLSGEVHEQRDGSFNIAEVDESILIQIDGRAP